MSRYDLLSTPHYDPDFYLEQEQVEQIKNAADIVFPESIVCYIEDALKYYIGEKWSIAEGNSAVKTADVLAIMERMKVLTDELGSYFKLEDQISKTALMRLRCEQIKEKTGIDVQALQSLSEHIGGKIELYKISNPQKRGANKNDIYLDNLLMSLLVICKKYDLKEQKRENFILVTFNTLPDQYRPQKPKTEKEKEAFTQKINRVYSTLPTQSET